MEKIKLKNGAEIPVISSRSNDEVISASKLSMKKYRERDGVFLLEGEKLFEEAVLYGEPRAVYVSLDSADRLSEKTLGYLRDPRLEGRVFALSLPAFEKITTEKSPQGVICSASVPGLCEDPRKALEDALEPGKRTLVLDGVRDPGNAGGILRTAAAFGCGSAILVNCADPFGDRAVRASMGAIFRIRTISIDTPDDLAGVIRRTKRRLVASALSADAGTLGSFETFSDDVVVIGNEGHGISDDMLSLCSATLRIPMVSGCESLNAASAAAVILWEYFKSDVLK